MLQVNHSPFPLRLLSDGITWGDGAGPFGLVPRPKWSKLLPPDEGLRLRSVCALHRTLLATAASRQAFRSMMRLLR